MSTLRVRASTVCVHQGKCLLVRLRDPQTQIAQLFPPGGGIEPGESAEQAAIRETQEETGYRVALTPVPPIFLRYLFVWNGVTYDCETTFFPAVLASPDPLPVQDADFVEGVEWILQSEVAAALAYHAALQSAVVQCLPKSK